jgi:hypothetical protein
VLGKAIDKKKKLEREKE